MSKRKWNELSEKETEIVKRHYEECMNDKSMECRNIHKNIIDFWESHKEMDYPNWK